MSVNSKILESKSPYVFWMWLGYAIVVTAVSFFVLSLFFFCLFFVLKSGLSVETFKNAGITSITMLSFPDFIFDTYETWWKNLKNSLAGEGFDKLLLLPFISIISTIVIILKLAMRCPSLRKRKGYFATIDEISEMKILGHGSMLFGRLNDLLLKSKGKDSSLVWFGKGLGKTTAVAIPTVLDADNSNVVAADCSGIMARFTSGYRSQISKVFNFNWDKTDVPEEGEFYPRWNPLSAGNLPKSGAARNNYIKFISQYLVVKDAGNYWEKLASTALEGLIHFFVSKTEQAIANDYFLSQLSDNKKLTRDILGSYYAFLPEEMANEALIHLENGTLNLDNYLPIGSWYNIPALWQGKELCFSMIIDSLIYKYCLMKPEEETDNTVIWKNMLEEFVSEARFFGYNPHFITVFEYLKNLSKKQRWAVFSLILEALSIFRKDTIRERTSLSDFSVHNARGMINEETGKQTLVTVYSGAYTKESAFMTGFFIDMILGATLHSKNTSLPLLYVLDDFELLPRLKLLDDLLGVNEEANISSMFLTNEIDNVNDIYNKNILEDIINKTTYKLISAEDNASLVSKLGQLSMYDSKANQINMKSGINYMANPQMAFKSQAYHMLSKDLMSGQLKGQFSKGKYLLLVDGFYNFPIKTDSLFFAKNYELKTKASLKEVSSVDENIASKRNIQDIKVPNIVEVMKESGINISSEEEVEEHLDKRRKMATEYIPKVKDSHFRKEDMSKGWKNTKKQNLEKMKIETMEEEDNWWMGENAFSTPAVRKNNPFDN